MTFLTRAASRTYTFASSSFFDELYLKLNSNYNLLLASQVALYIQNIQFSTFYHICVALVLVLYENSLRKLHTSQATHIAGLNKLTIHTPLNSIIGNI